jgi:hypothetical protein
VPRFVDRRAVVVVALPGDVARTDAYTQLQRYGPAASLPVDRALHLRGACDGGTGGVEGGNHAVSQRLDPISAVGGEYVAQSTVVLAPQRVGSLVAQARPHPRQAGEVGDEDRRGRAARLYLGGVLAGRPASHQRRVVGEDRLLQALELRTRRKAEIGVEGAHRVAVRVERLSLPPGAVQGEHELGPQPLAQRLARYQLLELADELGSAANGQVGLEAVLDRRGAQPLQSCDLDLREGLEGDIGQRRPAPFVERRTQPRRGALRTP